MTILSRYSIFGSIKSWLVAIASVLAVLGKLLYDRGEKLERALEVANAKVKAARMFRANRRKVRDMDISDIDADIRRLFPPSSGKSGPGS